MGKNYLDIFGKFLKEKNTVGLERTLNSHVLIIDGL